MISLQTLEEKKELFKLPYHKNQIEYWGPVESNLADAFLSMTSEFLKKFLLGVHGRHLKDIFSAFVELVQNVAEYNKAEFEEQTPPAYLSLVVEKSHVHLTTSNQIKEKDIPFIEGLINDLRNSSKEDLKVRHKEALLEGKSLGLILIMKMRNAQFDFKIEKATEDLHWLCIETTINYESTEN